MDRDRDLYRAPTQERQDTSRLIQQLAEQRERRLQAAQARQKLTVASAEAVITQTSLEEGWKKPTAESLRNSAAPACDLEHVNSSLGMKNSATTAPSRSAQQSSSSSSRAIAIDVEDSDDDDGPLVMRRTRAEDALVDDLISKVETIDLTAEGSATASKTNPQDPVSTNRAPTAANSSSASLAPAAAGVPSNCSSQNAPPASQQGSNSSSSSSSGPATTSSSSTTTAAAVAAAASVPLDDSDAAKAPPADLTLAGGFKLAGPIASKLYPHQVVGVKWLWSLHTSKKGGILADDMGLGKTMQCAAFLAAVLKGGLAKRALIVAPKTLLDHWEKELRGCGLRGQVHSFHSSSTTERNHALAAVTRRGGVLLTTYGMVLHNSDSLKLDCAEQLQGGCRVLGHSMSLSLS